jgi:DNA polymerase-3 subunit alpha
MEPQSINRRMLEYLAKAGAMDGILPNRRKVFESVELVIGYCASCHEERSSAQVSLFGGPDDSGGADVLLPKLPDVPDWDRQLKLQGEMEAIGFYLSGHPLEDFMPYLPQVRWSQDFSGAMDGGGYKQFTCAGVVVDKKMKVSQRGRFAFVGLSDPFGAYEVSIFDEQLLEAVRNQLENGAMLVLSVDGKMEEGGPRLIATRIQSVEDVITQTLKDVTFRVQNPDHLRVIRKALTPKPGAARVAIRIVVDGRKAVEMQLPERYTIRPEEMSAVRELVA